MDALQAVVGREVLGSADGGIVDLTVELARRGEVPARWRTGVLEPEDKLLVRLRGDGRGPALAPTVAYLESGAARQLASTLIRAADLADDLGEPCIGASHRRLLAREAPPG